MNPILSIIIPTKDRYRTLTNLVDKLMTWESKNFEIIVHDNTFDNKDIIRFNTKYADDPRLRYFHIPHEQLSVTDSASRAIDHSKGEFICFLGDDDGVICQAIEVVEWMSKNNVDSLNCSHGSYCWPEFRFGSCGKKRSLAGMLLYRTYSGSIKFVDPKMELRALLEDGALRINQITRVYHGIVSRRCLDQLKAVAGTYFPGPVADMSSAVGLSFFSRKHMVLDYPLIIAGASGTSFAGRSGQRKSHGKIEDEPGLPKDTVLNWSKSLPKYLTGQTIWPESAIQALIRTSNEPLIKNLNLPKIYAEYLVDFPELSADFENFLQETYSSEEIENLKKSISKYKVSYRINKLKYWVKVYAVYFNVHKLLKLQKIDGDNIFSVLSQLESETDKVFKSSSNSSFLSNVLK